MIFVNSLDVSGNINLVSYTNTDEYMQAQRTIGLNSCKDNINMANCAYKWSNEKFYGMKVIDCGKNENEKQFQLYNMFQITECGDLYLQSFSYANFEIQSFPKFENVQDPPFVVERFDEEENSMMEREFLRGTDLDNMTNFKQVSSDYIWDTVVPNLRKETKIMKELKEIDKSTLLKHLKFKNGCSSAFDMWNCLKNPRNDITFGSFIKLLDELCQNDWKGIVKKRNLKNLGKNKKIKIK